MREDPANPPAALTDEDVERATGGGGIAVIHCVQCPACGHFYSFTSRDEGMPAPPPCPGCGHRWGAPVKPGGTGAGA